MVLLIVFCRLKNCCVDWSLYSERKAWIYRLQKDFKDFTLICKGSSAEASNQSSQVKHAFRGLLTFPPT